MTHSVSERGCGHTSHRNSFAVTKLNARLRGPLAGHTFGTGAEGYVRRLSAPKVAVEPKRTRYVLAWGVVAVAQAPTDITPTNKKHTPRESEPTGFFATEAIRDTETGT